MGLRVTAVDRNVEALAAFARPFRTTRQVDIEAGEPRPLGGGYDAIVVTNRLCRQRIATVNGPFGRLPQPTGLASRS